MDEEKQPWVIPEKNDGASSKEMHEVVSKRLLEVFKTVHDDPLSAKHTSARNPLVLKAITKLKKLKNDDLSSQDFKVLNKRFMSGHLPRSKPIDEEKDEDSEDDDNEFDSKTVYYATDKSKSIEKIVKTQMNLLLTIRNYALKYASRYGNSWMRTVIPTNQIATLISFILYTYILNSEFLLYFLPLFFFVSSFIVVVVSTLRLLRGEKRFKEFVAWSELLGSVDCTLNVTEAEDNYFKKHISPLISLPPAVILNVLSFSAASTKILPISELALSSLGLCFASFYSFYPSFNKHSLYAIGFNLFASLLEGFQRLSSDPNQFLSFAIAVFDGFQLNFSLSILARFASLGLILSIPFQSRFRTRWVGVIRGSAPVFYVLLWWEMFSLFFVDSNFTGMVRAGLGLLVLFCSIPLTIILFFVAIIRWLLVFQILKITLLTFALVLPLLYLKYVQPQYNFKDTLKYVRDSFGPALKILLGVFFVTFAVALIVFYRPSGLQIYNSNLTWTNYSDICLNKEGDTMHTKRLCHQLNGYHIDWIGSVKNVQILNIDNKFESVLRVLPGFFANWLSCVYGEKYVEEPCTPDLLDSSSCFAKRRFLRDCHMDYYNNYQFAVVIQQTPEDESIQIKLSAGNNFKDLMFLLRPEMRIAFGGELYADKATVKLKWLRILDKSLKKPLRRMAVSDMRVSLHDSFKALLQFFFSPFLTFTQTSEELD